MRGIFGFILLLSESVFGQYHIVLHIMNEDSKQPIAGASILIKNIKTDWTSDSTGFVRINNLTNGSYTLYISCTGYTEKEIKAYIPIAVKDTLVITMEQNVQMLGEVI